MTEEQLAYCEKHLLAIKIKSTVTLKEESHCLNGSIENHLKCYDDSVKLNDSALICSYFDKEIYPNADFDNNGNLLDGMVRVTIYELIFKDFGQMIMTDEVNGVLNLWYMDSDMTTEVTHLFEDEDNIVGTIFDYFLSLNKGNFKFNDKEAYLSIPEIGMI